jgi:hypothetical protein
VTRLDADEVRRRLEAEGPWARAEPAGAGRFLLTIMAVGQNAAAAARNYFGILARVLPLLESEREYTELEREILAATGDGRADLDLSNRDITELPLEIGLAEGLKSLSVSGNRLRRLTAAIGMLTRLKELDIAENQLTGLPREIGNLRNLETLIANNNELAEIPGSIRHLGKLLSLDLEHNRLEELPMEIGWLTGLNRLWVAHNRLKKLPPGISRLTQLKDWDFKNQRSLPPRFPWALTVNGNPLEDPPAEIRGVEAIRAYLRRSPQAEREMLEIEGATTEAEYREIVDWIAGHAGAAVHELVGGPSGLLTLVQLADQRMMVHFDELGIVWIEWDANTSDAVRELAGRLKDRRRLAEGLAGRSTADLIELEAGGRFALGEEWAEAIFYAGAEALPGGMGHPVMQVAGTGALRLEMFHRPPRPGERLYAAGGMTCARMMRDGKPVYHDGRLVERLAKEKVRELAEDRNGAAGAPPTPLPALLLIVARARMVCTSGHNLSIPGSPLQDYVQTEILQVTDIRPLWVLR